MQGIDAHISIGNWRWDRKKIRTSASIKLQDRPQPGYSAALQKAATTGELIFRM